MRAMANSAVAVGILILMLVLAATVLSVTFATKGAMAANRPIVEVLHLIGAKDGFIAGQFQRHFLLLGIKGGAIGGGARHGAVRARRAGRELARAAPSAAINSRRCSARFRSAGKAMRRSRRKSC